MKEIIQFENSKKKNIHLTSKNISTAYRNFDSNAKIEKSIILY